MVFYFFRRGCCITLHELSGLLVVGPVLVYILLPSLALSHFDVSGDGRACFICQSFWSSY